MALRVQWYKNHNYSTDHWRQGGDNVFFLGTVRGGSSIFWKWGPNKNTNQRALGCLGSALGAFL